MAQSSVCKNFRDGKITIKDGTGSPIEVEILYEPGDFSVSGLSEGNYEVNAYQDRGEHACLRRTVRTYPSGSFTCYATDISDATDKLPYDAVMKTGAFSAGVSTLGANAEVWATLLEFDCEGTDHGDSADHQLTYDDCRTTIDYAEGDPNIWTVNWTCYGAVGQT